MKTFHLIRVPAEIHTLIRELEQKAMAIGAAQGREAVEEAYSVLSFQRKFLYDALEDRVAHVGGEKLALLKFV